MSDTKSYQHTESNTAASVQSAEQRAAAADNVRHQAEAQATKENAHRFAAQQRALGHARGPGEQHRGFEGSVQVDETVGRGNVKIGNMITPISVAASLGYTDSSGNLTDRGKRAAAAHAKANPSDDGDDRPGASSDGEPSQTYARTGDGDGDGLSISGTALRDAVQKQFAPHGMPQGLPPSGMNRLGTFINVGAGGLAGASEAELVQISAQLRDTRFSDEARAAANIDRELIEGELARRAQPAGELVSDDSGDGEWNIGAVTDAAVHASGLLGKSDSFKSAADALVLDGTLFDEASVNAIAEESGATAEQVEQAIGALAEGARADVVKAMDGILDDNQSQAFEAYLGVRDDLAHQAMLRHWQSGDLQGWRDAASEFAAAVKNVDPSKYEGIHEDTQVFKAADGRWYIHDQSDGTVVDFLADWALTHEGA